MRKLIFVGPEPGSPHIAHAGGQLTATLGFADYAARSGIEIEWIDTSQSNFPVPPALQRIARAGRRLARFARAIASPAHSGAILFAGAGVSFLERSLMAFAARACGKPAVLMIRSGHFRTSYRNSTRFRLLAGMLLKIPHRVGVQGESWVPLLREAGLTRERIVIVPNWLSRAPAAPRVRTFTSGGRLRLLFAGWMTAAKGVPELIEAAHLLASTGSNTVLTLVGGGTLLDEATAAASDPAVAGTLVVTGWLDREAMAGELAAADILVLPSHAEGFPNIVMEALAEGLPVIATPVGAIPDSVQHGHNGTIVKIGDAAAIADAVRSYLADPAAVERQSRAAIATAAERHDLDANCRALVTALSPARGDLEAIGR